MSVNFHCHNCASVFQYLIIDTQMIMGGTHRQQISSEEYIFAALTLYLDIVNIFLYLLQLLSAAQSGGD